MTGITIHCEVVSRAGQRNATRGNAGLTRLALVSVVTRFGFVFVLDSAYSGFFFLRGRCDVSEDIFPEASVLSEWQTPRFPRPYVRNPPLRHVETSKHRRGSKSSFQLMQPSSQALT